MSLCACGAEMGTGGCTQPWRHPTSISGYNWPPPPGFVEDLKATVDAVRLIANSVDTAERKIARILALIGGRNDA